LVPIATAAGVLGHAEPGSRRQAEASRHVIFRDREFILARCDLSWKTSS